MSDPKPSSGTLATPCKPTREICEQVRKWILAGHSEYDITTAMAEKWPDLEARPMIAAVMGDIAKTIRKVLGHGGN